jgi:hypothetical protein
MTNINKCMDFYFDDTKFRVAGLSDGLLEQDRGQREWHQIEANDSGLKWLSR